MDKRIGLMELPALNVNDLEEWSFESTFIMWFRKEDWIKSRKQPETP